MAIETQSEGYGDPTDTELWALSILEEAGINPTPVIESTDVDDLADEYSVEIALESLKSRLPRETYIVGSDAKGTGKNTGTVTLADTPQTRRSAPTLTSGSGKSLAPEALDLHRQTRGRKLGASVTRRVFQGEEDPYVLEEYWQNDANCLGVDPNLFFPERGASTRTAKEVCRGCAVREQCLEFALQSNEKFGIWGGLSERERKRIRRQRAQAARTITGA